MMRRAFICLLLATAPLVVLRAQSEVGCEQAYGMAKGLYDDGRLFESLHVLDSLVPLCGEDKDQEQRILFLKAVIEAQNDSVKAMRRTMERLFRNDRHYVLKPYDPLIVQLPAKAEIFDTYERLVGGRGSGPGLLRKDQGLWRAGVFASGQRAVLDMGTARPVFEGDALPDYTGGYGWEAGGVMERDVVPNLAVRASVAWSLLDYKAEGPSIRYKERVTMVPISLGVKKMFWLGDLPFVPYVLVEATCAPVVSVEADIARSGDGLRFLAPRSLRRDGDRESRQLALGGVVGVGRRFGNVVLYAEARYRRALGTFTREGATYVESELLTNYYWLDRPTTIHGVGIGIGAQYVLRYHKQNRIYP